MEDVTEKTSDIQRDFWGHSKGIELLGQYGCVLIVYLYGLSFSFVRTWRTILKWYLVIDNKMIHFMFEILKSYL